MHHDSLEFHNVAELLPAPGGGLHLARFPASIWPHVEAPLGSDTIRTSSGCEIRFVSDAPRFRLYLRSLAGEAHLVHLRGNQIYCEETLPAGAIHCLDIHAPPLESNRDPAIRKLGGFSPDVYRVVSVGATLAYHGMDPMGGSVRPPESGEAPLRCWLAYGSSITQSGGSFFNYVNAAAQMLEADALNLGMSGSCRIEPAIADFIASRDDWDFASFELGVNMMNPDCDNTRFAEKVAYLLDTVTAAHPDKPLYLITLFRNGTYHERETSDWWRDTEQKNTLLREAAARHPGLVTLVEGTDIVPDLRGFQVDLLHPQPFAYARMGLNLAKAMEAEIREG